MPEKQTIKDDGSINQYASVIPHMADDDLDPFQMRLYIHYKKMFALHGGCEESVRETAKATKMHTKTVTKARDGLAELGYIVQVKPTKQEARKGQTVHVTLVDRWAENVNRYAKPVADLPQVDDKGVVDLLQGVADMPQVGGKPVADLLHANVLPVANMLRSTSLDKRNTTNAARPPNPWYNAIQSVWGHTASRNRDMEKLLRGTATKKPYSEYNLETPLTDPQQLLNWKSWYLKIKNRRPDAILPSRLETVQSSIGEYQTYLEKRQAAQIIPMPSEKIEPVPTDAKEYVAWLSEQMGKTS